MMLRFISVGLLFLALVYASNRTLTYSSDTSVSRSLNPVVFVDNEEEAKSAFDQLNQEFQSAIEDLRREIDQLDTEQERATLFANSNPAGKYAAKFLDLARKYPNTKSAVSAVLFAVGQSSGGQKVEAIDYLLDNYADRVRLDKIAESFKREIPSEQVEGWYQLMIEKATKDSIRASVMYDYAKYVAQLPTFQSTLKMNPQVADRIPPKQLEYIYAERTNQQTEKLAEILQEVIDKYGDLKKGKSTYRQLAQRERFDLLHLQVGQTAPDIEGKDLDDIPFKLSDYRGKVVMLDFWGHWCPPCRAMYAHEQDIVRELADKPFVLIGVNSDAEKETAIEAVNEEALHWRHFWNGPNGTKGPIADKWNVEGWPTVYLIDGDGVIRYKEVLGVNIDRGIEKLLAEMGHEVTIPSE
ncbi:MAG: TlpA disulfide reductase family protein [Planctomycetota bacterium]